MKPTHHINRPKNVNRLLFAATSTLPQRPLTSRIQRRMNTMPGIPYKNVKHSKICSTVDLLIHSGIYILMKKMLILGGRIVLTQGRKTSVGV